MPPAERPRISVALCTRDGERFVAEQLTSIIRQRRPPDELVLFDDHSADGTVATAERVLQDAPFASKIIRNANQLGVTASFAAAIAAVSGDVIVLADQDDVWRPHKLERIVSALAQDDDVLAVCSDASLIDGHGATLPGTLWGRVGVSGAARRRLTRGDALEQLVRWKVVTGAALGFSSRLTPHLLPMPEGTLHDTWIALMAALLGRVVAIPEPLLAYRLHDTNAVGLPSRDPRALASSRAGDTDARREELAMFELAFTRAAEAGADPHRLALIARKVAFLEARAGLDRSPLRRIGTVARGFLTGRYHELGHGVRSAAHDLVYGR